MTISITPATRTSVTVFLKPAVDNGIISREQYQAIMAALLLASNRKAVAAPKPEHLLTAAEAAKQISCSSKTIRRYADKGLLRRVYIEAGNPKSLRFRAAEVAALGGAQ